MSKTIQALLNALKFNDLECKGQCGNTDIPV